MQPSKHYVQIMLITHIYITSGKIKEEKTKKSNNAKNKNKQRQKEWKKTIKEKVHSCYHQNTITLRKQNNKIIQI